MVSVSLENINIHSVNFIVFLNGDVLLRMLIGLRVIICIMTLWPQQMCSLIVARFFCLQTIVIDHSEVQCVAVHLRKKK